MEAKYSIFWNIVSAFQVLVQIKIKIFQNAELDSKLNTLVFCFFFCHYTRTCCISNNRLAPVNGENSFSVFWATTHFFHFFWMFGSRSIHSQKQLVQWAVYVTAEFYACMLSGWLGCNFCIAYVQPNGGRTYTVLNQLTLVWVQWFNSYYTVQTEWVMGGPNLFFFQNNFNHDILFSNGITHI